MPLPFRLFDSRHRLFVCLVAMTLAAVTGCGKKPVGSLPPTPVDFAEAREYAVRAALAYDADSTIQQSATAGVRISVSAPLSSGIKAYVEQNDATRVQWIVVRGTSNIVNIRLDVDYNKLVDSRLQIPLHKGFADSALQVYQFAKPLLKMDYETRIAGHSLGGAAAVIVLMLLKEDGFKLGHAITFGQPKVTNRDGARKYQNLPLLRFIDAKDPVPLLPPFEVFAILDEGPYVHIGPEVILEDGPNYQYFSAHQAQRLSVLSFWNNLKNISIQDIPEHQMSTYLKRIEQKTPAPAPTK
jgi:predicted small lipoprotein YifL